jgi:hypothetical protein
VDTASRWCLTHGAEDLLELMTRSLTMNVLKPLQATRPMRAAAALVAVSAAMLVGCADSARDTARFQRATPVTAYPVTIVAVDGVPMAGTAMAPGLRKITVLMPRAAGFKDGEQRTIDLDVKACTKYWLVALRDSHGADTYDVKVDHEQRVYSCTPPTAG